MRAASICMPASERRDGMGWEGSSGDLYRGIHQSINRAQYVTFSSVEAKVMLHLVLSKQKYACYCTTTYTP